MVRGRPICLITIMITDWIGRHKVLSPINHNYHKICDILGFFLSKIQEIPSFFCQQWKKSQLGVHMRWRVLSNYLGTMRTVLLHCSISVEIRTVDSQTDLRILL